MLDCCNGYTVVVQVGVFDEFGNLITTTKGMDWDDTEDIVMDVLGGDCPVCNGKLILKANA